MAKNEKCVWTQIDGDPNIRKTSCNNTDAIISIDSSDFADYGFKFCPYCGREIEVKP